MYCRSCGYKNADDAKFCKGCGVKIEIENHQNRETGSSIINEEKWNEFKDSVVGATKDAANRVKEELNKEDIKKYTEKLKQIPKKLLVGIGVGVAAVVVIICLAVNAYSTINLDKYVTVFADGYDRYGTVSLMIDWDAIEADYGDRLSYEKGVVESVVHLLATPTDILQEYISIDSKTVIYAHNGQDIEYSWYVNEAICDVVDCKLKYKNGSVTVSGLEEVQKVNPFDYVDVAFTGVAPCGTAEIVCTGDVFIEDDFYFTSGSNVNVGDTVTLCFDTSDESLEYYGCYYGVEPTEFEKEYTVDELDKYVTEISEIDVNTKDALLARAKQDVNDYILEWDSEMHLDSVSYVGDYLLVSEYEYSGVQNVYGMIYKINGSIDVSDEYAPTKVEDYYYVEYENIVLKSDNTCVVDLENFLMPEENFLATAKYGEWSYQYYSYYFMGCKSLEDTKKAIQRNLFTCYWNVSGDTAVTFSSSDFAENSTDFLCTYSSERELTKKDIDNLINENYDTYNFPGDRSIVQMVINEMYAKKGYLFTDDELQKYFNAKEWYAGITNKTNDMDGIYKNMSAIEKANIELLKEYKE